MVDDTHVLQIPWAHDPAALRAVFTHSVWDFHGLPSNYYRPMMYVSWMVVAAITGGLQPWALHLLNVLMHVAASVLVFVIVARLVTPGADTAKALALPAMAGIVFAVHPIHTEPVAWVAAVVELGYSLFCLVSLWLYVSAVEDRSRLRMAGAAVAFFIGTLYKESALTFPLVLLAYEVAFRRDEFSIRVLARRMWPFAAAIAAYLSLRIPALGGFAPHRFGETADAGTATLVAVDLFAKYVEKLFLPIGLNAWHAYVPPSGVFTVGAACALLIGLAFSVAAVFAVKRRSPVLVGLTAIVAPLVPALQGSALNQGLESAFMERYLYLPSFGFVFAGAAAAAALVSSRTSFTRTLGSVVGVIAVVGTAATVVRNQVWKDSITLWSDVASKSPGRALAHANLGYALASAGRHEEARIEFRRAIALDPQISERGVERGLGYVRAGLTTKAILQFHAVLALNPTSARAHYELGALYERMGARQQAAAEYEAALQFDPANPAVHNNLGVLYAEDGATSRAVTHFEAAVRLSPENDSYRANLRRALDR